MDGKLKNILFICVDCLREDYVSSECLNTPYFDSLSSQGTYFSNMYATTSTTTPSVASIFTGYYSENNGVTTLRDVSLNPDIDTLAEVLQQNGYSTYAMVTGPLVGDTKLNRGFDEYHYRNQEKTTFGPWSSDLVDKIKSFPQPFFCYLHLWEIHKPICVPSGFDKPKFGKSAYSRSLAALDRKLEMISELTPEDTIIMLHGDHGESISYRDSFFQHALRRLIRVRLRYNRQIDTRNIERLIDRIVARIDGSPYIDRFFEDGHGENIFDFVMNVPYLYKLPDDTGQNITAQVRQVDIFPTILSLIDVEYDFTPLDGKPMTPVDELQDRPAYMRACGTSLKGENNWIRGVRKNGKKFIEYQHLNWEDELFDIQSDPYELSPISCNFDQEQFRNEFPDNELSLKDELQIDNLLEDLGYL